MIDRGLLDFRVEPPVRDPPTFTTWPSKVTTLYLLFILVLISLAESMLSAIIIFPSTFDIILVYLLLYSTREEAIPR